MKKAVMVTVLGLMAIVVSQQAFANPEEESARIVARETAEEALQAALTKTFSEKIADLIQNKVLFAVNEAVEQAMSYLLRQTDEQELPGADMDMYAVTVILINGTAIAYCSDGVNELYHWRNQAITRFSNQFRRDFRSALDAYFYYIASHGTASSLLRSSDKEKFFNEVEFLLVKFNQTLILLDKEVTRQLGYLTVRPEAIAEVARFGRFADIFPPSVPTVMINGIPFNALAVNVLQQKMARLSTTEWRAMQKELIGIINLQFNKQVRNIPEFAKWYHGFGNDMAARSVRQLRGTWEDHRNEKFNDIINRGVNSDIHVGPINSFRMRADMFLDRILDVLILCALDKDNALVFAGEEMSVEYLLRPYTLMARVVGAGNIFGIDTSGWDNGYSRLVAGIGIGFEVLGLGFLAGAIVTLNPIGIAVGAVASAWNALSFPFTVGGRRDEMEQDLRRHFSIQRAELESAVRSL